MKNEGNIQKNQKKGKSKSKVKLVEYELEEDLIIVNAQKDYNYSLEKDNIIIEHSKKEKHKQKKYYMIKPNRQEIISNTRTSSYYCQLHLSKEGKKGIFLVGQMEAVGRHYAADHPEKITDLKNIMGRTDFILSRCMIYANRADELFYLQSSEDELNLVPVLSDLAFNKSTVKFLDIYEKNKDKYSQDVYSNAGYKLMKTFLIVSKKYLKEFQQMLEQLDFLVSIDEESKKKLIDIKFEEYVNLDLYNTLDNQICIFLSNRDYDKEDEKKLLKEREEKKIRRENMTEKDKEQEKEERNKQIAEFKAFLEENDKKYTYIKEFVDTYDCVKIEKTVFKNYKKFEDIEGVALNCIKSINFTKAIKKKYHLKKYRVLGKRAPELPIEEDEEISKNNDIKFESNEKEKEKEINKYKKLDEEIINDNLRVSLPVFEEIDTTVKDNNKIEPQEKKEKILDTCILKPLGIKSTNNSKYTGKKRGRKKLMDRLSKVNNKGKSKKTKRGKKKLMDRFIKEKTNSKSNITILGQTKLPFEFKPIETAKKESLITTINKKEDETPKEQNATNNKVRDESPVFKNTIQKTSEKNKNKSIIHMNITPNDKTKDNININQVNNTTIKTILPTLVKNKEKKERKNVPTLNNNKEQENINNIGQENMNNENDVNYRTPIKKGTLSYNKPNNTSEINNEIKNPSSSSSKQTQCKIETYMHKKKSILNEILYSFHEYNESKKNKLNEIKKGYSKTTMELRSKKKN